MLYIDRFRPLSCEEAWSSTHIGCTRDPCIQSGTIHACIHGVGETIHTAIQKSPHFRIDSENPAVTAFYNEQSACSLLAAQRVTYGVHSRPAYTIRHHTRAYPWSRGNNTYRNPKKPPFKDRILESCCKSCSYCILIGLDRYHAKKRGLARLLDALETRVYNPLPYTRVSIE